MLTSSSSPGDHLDGLLEILLSAADIAQGRVKRVMAHNLSQAMQRDDTGQLIAEPVAEILRRDCGEVRPLCNRSSQE